ncbi:MAG: metallophosphoesterase, partial [Lachnospiraceae bacterium]|nr:metallophosphoesterase [Lachnospiraceae bacterium]
MEIAVFSDIHGNYAAFERCIEYVSARNINTFIFLGDYLGEFPYPQKTM